MSQFYFAWVGDNPIPAVTVATTGDVWGGSIDLIGSVWGGELHTTGDLLPPTAWMSRVRQVLNLRDVSGLRNGQVYLMTGNGIATATDGLSPNTYLTYDSTIDGGNISLAGGYRNTQTYPEPAENAAITLRSDVGRNEIVLEDSVLFNLLIVGNNYRIAGGGIPDNTTFTWLGNPTITLSQNAVTTGFRVQLTISTDANRNLITNIGSIAGLTIGDVYQVFGRGIGATTLATLQSDGTLLLTENATRSTKQTFLRIHHGTVYPDGGAFDPSVHARDDEQVLSVAIDHTEGNFPLLTIELRNPHTGFLAPGRNIWCWLSWKDDANIVYPLFHGRLMAVPSNIQGEKVRLQFIARPSDFENRQRLLMAGLRVVPYWDPIWLANGIDDPNSILEARTAAWHTDRITLEVTISDITVGEDGSLAVGSDQGVGYRHLYESLQIKYGNPPLSAVYITGSVSWAQTSTGDVDITRQMVNAFQTGGSTYNYPNISTYSGDGMFSSWPKPLTGIGGGWSIGLDTTIIDKTALYRPLNLESKFRTAYPIAGIGAGIYISYQWEEWATLFPLNIYAINFICHYDAKRDWTENVSIFLEADVQQISSDSRASVESFALSSSLIQQAVDPGGVIPLADFRYNSYFKTARGQDSFKFLLAYARAKLVWRARAVDISYAIPWAAGLGLSCRQNGVITDTRLMGGTATGKVIAYKLTASAQSGMRAEVTIGCTIGKGGAVAASNGVGSYASNGYMQPGYQTVQGGTIDLGDNSVTYENFDDFTVDDDGLDLFNMSAENVIKRISVSGNINQQRRAIAMVHSAITGKATNPPDPVGALKNCYAFVTLELVPVSGGAFLSEFAVDVSKLQIPKTIDLESV